MTTICRGSASASKFLLKVFSVLCIPLLVSFCAVNQVTTEMMKIPDTNFPILISIQPCIDSTGTESIDLGALATKTFEEQISLNPDFELQEDAKYVINCEVTSYLPGSATKRWVMPGWGATIGQIAAIVQDRLTGEVLVIIEGNANVSSGGLYTIGAEDYIIPTAVREVVQQLNKWVRK